MGPSLAGTTPRGSQEKVPAICGGKRPLGASRLLESEWARSAILNLRSGLIQTPAGDLPRIAFLREILIRYRAKPYVGDVVLFRSTAEPLSFEMDIGPRNGWEMVVQGGLRVEDFGCSNAEIVKEPHLKAVAGRTAFYLREAQYESKALIGANEKT